VQLWDSGDNAPTQIGFTFTATKKIREPKQTAISHCLLPC